MAKESGKSSESLGVAAAPAAADEEPDEEGALDAADALARSLVG
jgi:hypothetical protein